MQLLKPHFFIFSSLFPNVATLPLFWGKIIDSFLVLQCLLCLLLVIAFFVYSLFKDLWILVRHFVVKMSKRRRWKAAQGHHEKHLHGSALLISVHDGVFIALHAAQDWQQSIEDELKINFFCLNTHV